MNVVKVKYRLLRICLAEYKEYTVTVVLELVGTHLGRGEMAYAKVQRKK